ncbi:MAG TPA: hypothetical protein HA362_01840 [Nanoarchaeota archaeon]|nr:hypothetical protein [Nanoarchaeota archaeon]
MVNTESGKPLDEILPMTDKELTYRQVEWSSLDKVPFGQKVDFRTSTFIAYPPEDDGTRYMCMGEMGLLAFSKETFSRYFPDDKIFGIVAALLEERKIQSRVLGRITKPVLGLDGDTEGEHEGLMAAVDIHEFMPDYSLKQLVDDACELQDKYPYSTIGLNFSELEPELQEKE